jgi:endonuclease/exonuclease/phosphatase family metal-dependent hydrolase
VRVLSWNLFHGRSVPPAGRALAEEFARRIASWPWDVALLQEVPPWWPPILAEASSAQQRTALTSRNAGLVLRRAVAERWPDLIKSNGGGANAVLARSSAIAEHRVVRLRRRPERRVAQLVRLASGECVVNLHASSRVPLAQGELARVWQQALPWAGRAPLVVGGDLNLRDPRAPEAAVHVAARDVDHVFALGLEAAGDPQQPDRRLEQGRIVRELSDHPALIVELRPGGR